MEQRIAALYGHDPRELETSAQILTLRGVHGTVDQARTALREVVETPLPEKPKARRPLRVWVRSVYVVLVFGGFVSGKSDDEGDRYRHWLLQAVMGTLVATLIWLITWVFPVTFMIAMAWACESHARKLGDRTMRFYGGEAARAEAAAAGGRDTDRGRTKRELLRGLLIVFSVAIPVAFVAYADRVRQTTGINWLGALGALVAASIVVATTVIASRR